MTSFEWLTTAGTVQRTTFGDKIEMTANFGPTEFRLGATTLAKDTVQAKWRETGETRTYVP